MYKKVRNMIKELFKFLGFYERYLLYRAMKFSRKKGLRFGVDIISKGKTIELIKGKSKIVISAKKWFYIGDLLNDFDSYLNYIIPEKIDGLDIADYSKPEEHRLRKSDLSFYFSFIIEGE